MEYVKHDVIPYGGWNRCLRISNSLMDLVITLDVGPRIIRCGFVNHRNLFVEYPDQMGRTGDPEYHSYGGHRLWIAPEDRNLTYYPDNGPVSWTNEEDWVYLKPAPEDTGFQKEIRIRLDPHRAQATIRHVLTHRGVHPRSVAAWALSVMAPGGTAFIPHEPFHPHPERLLPVRPMVFWSYTDMRDPRWIWGPAFLRLRQDDSASAPQKIGAWNTKGFAGYLNDGTMFLKTFPAEPDKQYPDFGCNCEFFTNRKMLELESLSPLAHLAPGQSITLDEEWFLVPDVKDESDEGIASLCTTIMSHKH